MHRLLQNQFKKFGLSQTQVPDKMHWAQFVARVNRAYEDADQDRYLIERSLSISGREMRALFDSAAHEKDRLRVILDALTDGIAVFGSDLVLTHHNPQFERMIGVSSETPFTDVDDFAHFGMNDDRIEQAIAAMRRNDSTPDLQQFADVEVVADDGFKKYFNIRVIRPRVDDPRTAFIFLFSDVSELRRIEVELRHAQKLEAVGRLAAGIAHEINTPVQFVSDNISFLETAFAALETAFSMGMVGHPGRPGHVSEIESELDFYRNEAKAALLQSKDGLERVASIVRAMKSFAHPGVSEKTPADLNGAIESTLVVARNEIKYIADVETEFGDIPNVPCLIGDINQVVLNLLVNAAHAISDVVADGGGRGTITVRTFQEGGYVVVEIGDSGGGIPDDVAGHIFEPFFTTKDVGKGTGQGLALAHNVVVEAHGGTIDFVTSPAGTTFTLRLPVRAVGVKNAAVESEPSVVAVFADN